uniref:Urocanate hydratase n=1 Tax=Electrophorus electricus TaxID=8005 RepID=A0AAY5EGX0_ELEEL
MASLKELCGGLPLSPLPANRGRDPSVPHAPVRTPNLTPEEKRLALQNALRYFPPALHGTLAPEFAQELREYGHIYMYRFCPTLRMRAYPINQYPCETRHAAAIMHMIMNNLDPDVAQIRTETTMLLFHNVCVCVQFWLVFHYLSTMSEEQTLVMYSGHPLGLFPSLPSSPRCVITNGMVIPNYSSRENYERMFALGITMYGQMTAGSYCYIGPQGIVHGTMVDEVPLQKRYEQGWLMEVTKDLDNCIQRIREARRAKMALSLGYHGNVVDLWERLWQEYERTGELLVDLGSDQTSLHNPFSGGYYPVQLNVSQANQLMHTDPLRFRTIVHESLRRQVAAINKLSEEGMFFWDYGNAFLLEAKRAGAEVEKSGGGATEFKYPSYVQHIMGDIFSLGFGPFRWVCTSGNPADLVQTDDIATAVLEEISATVNERVRQQYSDNIHWIREAAKHNMVVGSQARILYSDQRGRVSIALAINKAVADGRVTSPVVISRDHHDVSGTDSPFRETSNIYDGSAFCADMAVQNIIGDAFRGATWVALHNGGGVGWGEVMNGGFGLVLDGSEEAGKRARMMLNWDVSNGVARRCWSGNANAYETIQLTMQNQRELRVTMPYRIQDNHVVDQALRKYN